MLESRSVYCVHVYKNLSLVLFKIFFGGSHASFFWGLSEVMAMQCLVLCRWGTKKKKIGPCLGSNVSKM